MVRRRAPSGRSFMSWAHGPFGAVGHPTRGGARGWRNDECTCDSWLQRGTRNMCACDQSTCAAARGRGPGSLQAKRKAE
eukprot:15458727-Alexandrium_andersonii.AAC.1